ncbi:MAG: hypothetical protein WAN43_20710 [Rhodomicrobium sp.]
MDRITSSAFASHLTREFDDFLFARLDEDGDEMPLSVLSMLARLDVDPWQEAAKLAQLPRASAAKRLIALIDAIPSAHLDAGLVSDRLIDLLPSPPALVILPQPGGRITASRFTVWAILMGFILVLQLILMSWQPTKPGYEPHAPSSPTSSPKPLGLP